MEVNRFLTIHVLKSSIDFKLEPSLKYLSAVFFIFQVIFGELFQLPVPPHIDVMYTTLLIELCKLQPGSLPQVVSFIVYVSTVLQNTQICLNLVLGVHGMPT